MGPRGIWIPGLADCKANSRMQSMREGVLACVFARYVQSYGPWLRTVEHILGLPEPNSGIFVSFFKMGVAVLHHLFTTFGCR